MHDKQLLELAIHRYIEEFEEKQSLYFDHWVNNDIGTIAVFDDTYFINFNDIRIDLENNIPKHAIIEWYDYSLDHHTKNKETINYTTFLKINDHI